MAFQLEAELNESNGMSAWNRLVCDLGMVSARKAIFGSDEDMAAAGDLQSSKLGPPLFDFPATPEFSCATSGSTLEQWLDPLCISDSAPVRNTPARASHTTFKLFELHFFGSIKP